MKKISIVSFVLSLSCASIIMAADQPIQFSYTTQAGITYKATYGWDASTNMRISRHEKHTLLERGLTKIETFILKYNNNDVFQHQKTVEYSQPKSFSLFNDPRFSTPKNPQNIPKKMSPIPGTYRAVVAATLLKDIEYKKTD